MMINNIVILYFIYKKHIDIILINKYMHAYIHSIHTFWLTDEFLRTKTFCLEANKVIKQSLLIKIVAKFARFMTSKTVKTRTDKNSLDFVLSLQIPLAQLCSQSYVSEIFSDYYIWMEREYDYKAQNNSFC